MDEELAKRLEHILEEYFIQKKKILYFGKGLSGAIVLWVYGFFSIFGSIQNYRETISQNARIAEESKELQMELARNPNLIAACILLIILSLILGYLIYCIATVVVEAANWCISKWLSNYN